MTSSKSAKRQSLPVRLHCNLSEGSLLFFHCWKKKHSADFLWMLQSSSLTSWWSRKPWAWRCDDRCLNPKSFLWLITFLLLINQVEMKPGVGPVFDKPLESPSNLNDLTIPDVKVTLHNRTSLSLLIPDCPQIRLWCDHFDSAQAGGEGAPHWLHWSSLDSDGLHDWGRWLQNTVKGWTFFIWMGFSTIVLRPKSGSINTLKPATSCLTSSQKCV